MEDKMIHSFNINGNINQEDIDKLIELYQNSEDNAEEVLNKNTGECFNSIEIIIDPSGVDSDLFAEIDPLFLGYLVLYLKRFVKVKAVFRLQNPYLRILNIKFSEGEYQKSKKIFDRAFSLNDQISFISNFLGFGERISLIASWFKKESKQVLPVLKSSAISQRFFPTILINSKENIDHFFDPKSKKNEVEIIYFNRIIEVVQPYKPLYIQQISAIEIFILRLLLSEDNPVVKSRKLSKEVINYYLKYSNQLASGIKELAINIVEHSRITQDSRGGIGVITGRIFDKERLLTLKGNNEKDFLTSLEDGAFCLDINVIDLGIEGIREKYIQNIKVNWENDLDNSFKINYESDIQIIQNKADFKFEDFYIPNTKTDHQLNKLISRYGLQYFTHILTKRFDAYVKIISGDESLIFEGGQSEVKSCRSTRAGTSYNCIIPFESFNSYYKSSKPKFPRATSAGEQSNLLIELHYHNSPKNLSDGTFNQYDLILFDDFPNYSDNKYELIKDLYLRFIKINEGLRKNIFLINAENSHIESATDWLRLLSQISLEFKNIVVFNIEKDTTKELIDNRRIQSAIPKINFWDEDSCVLFYSIKTDPDTHYFRYGASVLTGKNEGQYNFVNINVWKNHYSYYDGFLNNSVKPEEFYPQSDLFVKGNLKYFDLLIENKDEYGSTISLFEMSLKYALNKPLPDNLLKDTNNKGYKINDTHFRLGSKIHIESFYYAKRVFQNSFFTTPIAFLIASYIYDFIDNYNRNILATESKITEFTLIGYEDYSELLLSTTRSLLSKRLGDKYTISHNSFSSNSSLSRPLESIQKNIFIIVPIASSFSTSIKIKNELHYIFTRNDETKFKDINFIEPHLNIILVGDLKFESKTFPDCKEEFYNFNDLTLIDYGWHSIDKIKKLIRIFEFGDIKDQYKEQLVLQKYFIPVYSKWNRADDCEKCFPDKIVEERCLVETGQASITPKLIFGLPKTKPNNNNNILDLSDSIFYGNLKKGNNRYLYYTRVGEVINKKSNKKFLNLERIKEWLQSVKEKFYSIPDFGNKKVVLVTPSSSTSSNFIDLVNEYVFNYTANCLTISLYEDYIENSESLYADGLHKAEIVIFVDDVLLTTKSFLEINYIIKYIRKKRGKGTGIDYCITLINRMTFDSEENLLLKLAKLDCNIQENLKKATDKLLYFTKINNPSIEEPNGEFPLISESKRYKILSDTSSFDSIRSVFFEKYKKLREHNLLTKKDHNSIKSEVDDTVAYKNKKLYQLLILDKLYSLFEYECYECNSEIVSEETEEQYNNKRSEKIDSFFLTKNDPVDLDIYLEKFRKLADEIRGEFFENKLQVKQKYKMYEKILIKYDHNLDYVILKILCSTPIIYYKQLRESAFYWFIAVLEKLRVGWEEHNIIGINNLTGENLINYFKVDGLNYYSEYQKLKFLLKRSVQLKSNYLIHKDFLESIKQLINLLYNNYDSLNQKEQRSEDELVEKIKDLFNSKYTKGHLELYEYVESLRNSYVLSEDRADALKKDKNKSELLANYSNYKPVFESGTFQFDAEDPLELEFNVAFDKIRLITKYRLITSKKLIYDLICLNQELIYQNEPKAIKLENNIAEFKEEESNRNGDFSHFLRLLKLENTAAIENFWNYFYDKEKEHNNELLDILKIDKIDQYKNDPKFNSIDLLVRIDGKFDSFISFLKLKAELTNLEINRTGKSKIGSLEEEVKLVLKYSADILGETLEQCYLSVNYKYMLNPGADDIFFFDGHHVDKSGTGLYSFYDKEKIANSLNYKMYSGIIENCYDKYPLSNFEFVRNNGIVSFRADTNLDQRNDILKSTELSVDQKNCNVLIIKISDFTYNFPHSFRDKKHDEKDLVTQAVITFKLAQNARVDIKKLRLLLLLRSSLSRFINANILSNNLIEYINKKTNDRYQKRLGHSIDTYLSNQIEAYKAGALEEVRVLNDAIIGQIKAYQIAPNSQPESIHVDNLRERVKLLLESLYIYTTNSLNSNQYEISLKNDRNSFLIHKYILRVVLTEVIINARNHGTLYKPFISVYSELKYIVVRCKIDFDAPEYSPGNGIKMCQQIIEKYDRSLKLEIIPRYYNEESKTYNFIVKIPLANETN